MVVTNRLSTTSVGSMMLAVGAALMLVAAPAAHAADVTVTVTTSTSTEQANEFAGGLRWVLEEDSTYDINPASPPANLLDSASLQLHKSHMTVVRSGTAARAASVPTTGYQFTIAGLDAGKRYYLSVLPDRPDGAVCRAGDGCFTMSGAPVRFDGAAAANVTVILTPQPLPPAQAKIYAFEDTAPINNAPDAAERGLGGFAIFIYDNGGGQMMTDVFGNPLGTRYVPDTLDAEGAPTVLRRGDGSIHTISEKEVNDVNLNPHRLKVGEALIENIAPGKYGIQVVPPAGQGWKQTTTIEGTPGIDVWLRAGEPRFMVEFGPVGAHAFYGFVKRDFNQLAAPQAGEQAGNITGSVVAARTARPPLLDLANGPPVPGCWVGLNEAATGAGQYVARCDDDSNFKIPNVPPGTYQLVVWDDYLDTIISFFTVIINPDGTGGDVGTLAVPRWFGQHEHYVFNDTNGNGVRDPDEAGIPDQTINLRYRDGSIYGSSTTDTTGYLPFDEIFPFFSWLVAEVDFARFEAASVTIVSDAGGPVPADSSAGGVLPEGSRGLLNPQTQAECERLGASAPDGLGNCTGGNPQARVELADRDGVPPLLEGYNSFLGTTDVFLWGKRAWNPGENGGITGVVYYQTTRAENDPRFAAPETWEPGIPRVQVALYHADATGRLYHKGPSNTRGTVAGPGSAIVLADVDNYPFNDSTSFPGIEDVDHNGNGVFDIGDAIEVAHTDSWDDSLPEGCRPHQNPDGSPKADPFYMNGKCMDALRNYSQVRTAVFDGGYAFGRPFTDTPILPGYYVVQASPPRGAQGTEVYQVQQEEDKNVDFGDEMKISPQALPPYCVGGIATDGTILNNGVAPHDAGTTLALFSTPDGPVDIAPGFTGQRPGCDFRLVQVTDGKNAATDFFMFTETPITGHIQGFVLNDAANEFDPALAEFR